MKHRSNMGGYTHHVVVDIHFDQLKLGLLLLLTGVLVHTPSFLLLLLRAHMGGGAVETCWRPKAAVGEGLYQRLLVLVSENNACLVQTWDSQRNSPEILQHPFLSQQKKINKKSSDFEFDKSDTLREPCVSFWFLAWVEQMGSKLTMPTRQILDSTGHVRGSRHTATRKVRGGIQSIT